MLFTKVFLTSILLNFIFYSYGYFLKIFNSKLNKLLSVFIGFFYFNYHKYFYFYLNLIFKNTIININSINIHNYF